MNVVAILILCLMTASPVMAREGRHQRNSDGLCCKTQNGECNLQQRGRCGKRPGDCYGMRTPVHSAVEAKKRLNEYYAGRNQTVSAIVEKKWHYEAELMTPEGTVVDRVMIDKRSGRIRSRL